MACRNLLSVSDGDEPSGMGTQNAGWNPRRRSTSSVLLIVSDASTRELPWRGAVGDGRDFRLRCGLGLAARVSASTSAVFPTLFCPTTTLKPGVRLTTSVARKLL